MKTIVLTSNVMRGQIIKNQAPKLLYDSEHQLVDSVNDVLKRFDVECGTFTVYRRIDVLRHFGKKLVRRIKDCSPKVVFIGNHELRLSKTERWNYSLHFHSHRSCFTG
jgi:hypothetical protein